VKNHLLLLADKEKEKVKFYYPIITQKHIKIFTFNFLSFQDFDKWVTEALEPVAKKNKGKIIFVTLDTSVDSHKQILEFFGVKEADLPK